MPCTCGASRTSWQAWVFRLLREEQAPPNHYDSNCDGESHVIPLVYILVLNLLATSLPATRNNGILLCKNLTGNLDKWHDLCKPLKETDKLWVSIARSYQGNDVRVT